ncbi:MAG: glycosyltransferase family 4 protein, partial [Actinomycetes bacterium]
MRIGIVCPYAWDVPGGVSAHVHDLAESLIRMGHFVSVLAPAESDLGLPDFVVSTGKPKAVRYNGSVARLSFGPVTARKVSRWIEDGKFDVLHVHEPLAPSLSVLACWAAKGPTVATWHSSMDRSKMILSLAKLAQTAMEKISARIAVSEAARSTLVHHVGGDSVVIPNGVDIATFSHAKPMSGWPGAGKALVFLGRVDESRKGLDVLMRAYPEIRKQYPDLRLLIAGPGDASDAIANLPTADQQSVTALGMISSELKPSVLASGTIYVAPNTGGESFGIVLLEAMASGTPVVSSDLEAFSRVLNFGKSGVTFKNEDSEDLAKVIVDLLSDDFRLAQLKAKGIDRAKEFDWVVVAAKIVDVYESVRVPGMVVEPDLAGQMMGRLGRGRITPEGRSE